MGIGRNKVERRELGGFSGKFHLNQAACAVTGVGVGWGSNWGQGAHRREKTHGVWGRERRGRQVRREVGSLCVMVRGWWDERPLMFSLALLFIIIFLIFETGLQTGLERAM